MKSATSRHEDPDYAARHVSSFYWSKREDERLLHALALDAEEHPLPTSHIRGKWRRVAAIVQTRTSKQCRERYCDHLDPKLDHSPLRPSEKTLVEEALLRGERRWCKMAGMLRNRTANHVKNAYQNKVYGVYKTTPRGAFVRRLRGEEWPSPTTSKRSVPIGSRKRARVTSDGEADSDDEVYSFAAALDAGVAGERLWDAVGNALETIRPAAKPRHAILDPMPLSAPLADPSRDGLIFKGCFGGNAGFPLSSFAFEGGLEPLRQRARAVRCLSY